MGGKLLNAKYNIASLVFGISISLILSFQGVGEANSFPFRAVKIGDSLPAVTLRNFKSQQEVSLGSFTGKTLVIIFFGADIPAKKERSVKTLKKIEGLASFMESKGVVVLAVDVQGDPADVINEVISSSDISTDVYVDVDRSAYGGVGIFVMPSVLLVSKDGAIVSGLGYSHDLAKRLRGEVEIMLGEKTREQFVEELNPPKVSEESEEERGAARHFNLGMTMEERGQKSSAVREFKKAISLAPDMGKAYINLGCLQFDEKQIAEAKISLSKGMGLEPDSDAGRICLARIQAEEGDVDGAIDELEFMMFRNYRSEKLHYLLGRMLEKKGDPAGAMSEYRKAYELLQNNFQRN